MGQCHQEVLAQMTAEHAESLDTKQQSLQSEADAAHGQLKKRLQQTQEDHEDALEAHRSEHNTQLESLKQQLAAVASAHSIATEAQVGAVKQAQEDTREETKIALNEQFNLYVNMGILK